MRAHAALLLPMLLLVATSSQAVHAQLPPSSPAETRWITAGTGAAKVSVDTTGNAFTASGATLSIRRRADAEPPVANEVVNVSKRIVTDTLRRRRARVTGEIRTAGLTGTASLWMRVDGQGAMIVLDNGMDRALRGTTDWSPFSVTLPVTSGASHLFFGALVTGAGDVYVRGLRFEASPPSLAAPAMSDSARVMLDSALRIVKNRSVFRDTITWSAVERDVREIAAGAQAASEVYPALRMLVARLGDHHSGFYPPAAMRSIVQGGRENPPAEVKALPGGIGYVNMPGYSGIEQQAMHDFARRAHEGLVATAPTATCGWVVDTRRNTGGNMRPMLAALRPFLGDSALGYFVSPGMRYPWNALSLPAVVPPPSLSALRDAPVAVITGPRTSSSGEIVVISFIGRANTRSFGQPTGGFSSGNSMFPLPDGASLNVTTAIDASRTGITFGGKVPPDEPVAEATEAGAPDAPLAAAVRWLQSLPSCAR